MDSTQAERDLLALQVAACRPLTCRHCEYDRNFPGFEAGGWMQQDNNGPIVPCPVCNPDGSHQRDPAGQ